MKVLNLRCSQDHRFEGWFASDDDFQSQVDSAHLVCPLCGDAAITRLPSAPRLMRSSRGDSAAATATRSAVEAPAQGATKATRAQAVSAAQAQWLQRAREVLAATEDVGERFAAEARRIHDGKAPERAIRGQATAREAEALADDGIQVMAVPAVLKETLQ